MKNLKHLFTALLLLCSTMAFAEEATIDGIKYDVITKAKVATVIGGNYTGNIVIPEIVAHNGEIYSVTSIGEYAFGDCSGLKSITIPNSVTSIGEGAFYGCDGLTSVTIPNSVTSIGEYAFGDCSGLKSITIPNSVTSIGEGAFYGCDGLTSVTIPNSVTSIGEEAFSYCSDLTSVTIPNSVTSIGEGAFSYCSDLTSITVASGNTVYDSRDKCNAIIETATNTLIAGCKNAIIPNGVTNIEDDAFRGCSSLTSIEIPNSVINIGDNAFSYCSGLTSITIPNSVTSIGEEAFSKCSGLTSVTIGNNVTSICGEAFYYCSSLTDVYCHATTMPSISNYTFYSYYLENMTLHVPDETINDYQTTEPWSRFGTIVALGETIVINIPATAVLMTSSNGALYIKCPLDGEAVAVYTSGGTLVGTTTIANGNATIQTGLSKGSMAIVKIGDKSVKVIVD